ncbi:MAG: 50S ribosomal protein L17 [Bacteroidales bacterium]|nr:50S ribosomal protein L17 [Bacteroidales bacterium]MCF8333713.1 50S ribosomal protein L17 [Bacteroidales bacterium]
MRHRKKFNHLKRNRAHRQAMLSNMASSLIIHKRIHTTLAKAKALRTYVEPLITRCKNDSTHSRRVVFAHLQNKESVNELFREVATKVADRPGGYTRILKLGPRKGDSAEMAMMELVDYNENMLAEKEEESKSKKRTRRGGGGGRKKKSTPVAETSESTAQAQQTATEEAQEKTAEAEEQAVEEAEAEASKAEETTAQEAPAEEPEQEEKEEEKGKEAEEQQNTEAKQQESEEEKKDEDDKDDKEEDKKE